MFKLAQYHSFNLRIPALQGPAARLADELGTQFVQTDEKLSAYSTDSTSPTNIRVIKSFPYLNLIVLNLIFITVQLLPLTVQAQIQSADQQTASPSEQSSATSNPTSALRGDLNTPAPQIKLEGRPAWHDLEPNQKIALAPLQKMWPKISDFQRQKWLVISKNYTSLSSEEQARIQGRMKEWVSLSIEERAVARLNFAEVNKLSEDQKRVKWEAYQALEPDAKQKLLSQTQPLPKGAAIALKPTNKALLTVTPSTSDKSTDAKIPRIDTSQISLNTLLRTPAKSVQPAKVGTPGAK